MNGQDVGAISKAIPNDPTPMWLVAVALLAAFGLLYVIARWFSTTFTSSQRDIVEAMRTGFAELKEAIRDNGPRRAALLLFAFALAGCISAKEAEAGKNVADLQAQAGAAVESDRVYAVRSYHDEVTRLSKATSLAELERDLAVAAAGGATTRPTMSYAEVSGILRKFRDDTAANEAAFAALRDKFLALPASRLQAELAAVMQKWFGTKAADAAAAEKLLERFK